MIVPQLAAKVIDEDIILGPITSPQAMIAEELLKQFLGYISFIEGTITGLEGITNSIGCFDVALAGRWAGDPKTMNLANFIDSHENHS